MRHKYDEQLAALHTALIQMGSLCEQAISGAVKALLENDDTLRKEVLALEQETNEVEREIEQLCVRLLLHQQPVASDLRNVMAAQKMIVDMERIGDQAEDIAEIAAFTKDSKVKTSIPLAAMAQAASKMVTESIDSFVQKDLGQAQAVIASDDTVDALFLQIKEQLTIYLLQDAHLASQCLDLLMIAKYLERIGDHAENIAEWVCYSLTGKYVQ